jgi:hypothetical protein
VIPDFLKSKIILKAAEIHVYKTPINKTCGYIRAETWTLTVEKNALRMFERKAICRIYRPVMENNIWRIRYNEETNAILKGEDRVRFIKSRRLRWLRHVERMEDKAMPKRMIKGKLYSKRRK